MRGAESNQEPGVYFYENDMGSRDVLRMGRRNRESGVYLHEVKLEVGIPNAVGRHLAAATGSLAGDAKTMARFAVQTTGGTTLSGNHAGTFSQVDVQRSTAAVCVLSMEPWRCAF